MSSTLRLYFELILFISYSSLKPIEYVSAISLKVSPDFTLYVVVLLFDFLGFVVLVDSFLYTLRLLPTLRL